MREYHNMLAFIKQHGKLSTDRTGTGTYRVFGYQGRYDLSKGFPLLTTKRTHWKSIREEMLFFVNGGTNNQLLNEQGVSIWDEWADPETGNLGPIYGSQWRNWRGRDGFSYDQLQTMINTIRTNPHDRRLIVSSWHVEDIPSMALPPCHMFFQCFVDDGKLSLQMYMRSMDAFLGAPFNIAGYALLIHMLACVCDLDVGEFILTVGDAHIYTNHMEQVEELLSRDPERYPLPRLEITGDHNDINTITRDNIILHGYQSYPSIKAPVAV